MEITLLSLHIKRHDISTRMPFRYGIATLTHLPHLFLRAEVNFSGKIRWGITADHLPPKWFTKDPDRDPLEEIDEMLRVIEKAEEHARTISSDSVFGFWYELYQKQAAWAEEANIPPLLAHFGTSLIERALIDAFCRFRERPFHQMLMNNAFGIAWDLLRPDLSGRQPADLLPATPLSAIVVRHTVGLSDPIYEAEITPENRPDDHLPQSLEACITFYGLKHFKIKVNGRIDQDLERLDAIAGLFQRIGLTDFAFTLDGNEQFKNTEAFRDFWKALQGNRKMKSFFRHLLFIEQPFHRDIALTDETGSELQAAEGFPPMIIDESDATLGSLPRALELGYRGTSHKNCKGVFKGILNRATINDLNRSAGTDRYLMSGEDLSNIGPVSNHQDLVVQASLGNASVERNGHHYFKGLAMFDRQLQQEAIRDFPGLYILEGGDFARLNIRNGRLQMDELLNTPFGTRF